MSISEANIAVAIAALAAETNRECLGRLPPFAFKSSIHIHLYIFLFLNRTLNRAVCSFIVNVHLLILISMPNWMCAIELENLEMDMHGACVRYGYYDDV